MQQALFSIISLPLLSNAWDLLMQLFFFQVIIAEFPDIEAEILIHP